MILVASNVLRGVQGQDRQLDLTSTSERLFAGISTTSRNASPLGMASRTMSFYVAYTPTWVALFEVCVEGGIGRCRLPTANHEGPI